MRDFLPLETRRRQYLIRGFREVYERYGFDPIDTPALERLEVLLGAGGADNEKLIFKVLKRGESLSRSLESKEELSDAGLRFDLTVPLARYVVEHRSELPRVLRRYHIGPVWRAERPARGRFREFYQCDVDIVGAPGHSAEVEVILATADALREVGFGSFSVRLNDRRLLSALLASAGASPELHATAVIALDKLDKIGWEGVGAEFTDRGIGAGVLERLRAMELEAVSTLPVREALSHLAHKMGSASEDFESAVRDLGAIALDLGVARPNISLVVSPVLARGMGYYTGPIFEIASQEVSLALAGGGRYDQLIGRFAGQSLPAVGFSIGFERILELMSERQMFPESLSGVDAFVTVFDAEQRADSLRLADELRATGLRVLLALQVGGLKPQLKEANQRGARFALIAGPSEREQGVVQIKDMESGEAQNVGRQEVARHLSGAINRAET
jgi:histidyl-tRNA synthetase